jgi:hypothetical protein
MLSFNNKNKYIKYFFIAFLLIAIILSIQNLFEIREYIGGERPGIIVVNNYDYTKTIDDTKRKDDDNLNEGKLGNFVCLLCLNTNLYFTYKFVVLL